MNYTPFPISNFTIGYDRERQPWLLPDDAQFELLDGYVYLGVWQIRQGYSQLATGERGGSTYCESRMVHQLSNVPMNGTINGINRVFTQTLTTPVRRGTVVVTGSNPAQSFRDNSQGAFTGGGVTGTIDYSTGALSITLPVAPIVASTVTVTYDYHPGLPVMAVMDWTTQGDTRQLITCDTRYVNRYNSTLNILEDISPAYTFNGNETNFFSWTDYPTPTGLQRLLFVNFVDEIQQYDGTVVKPYPVYTKSLVVAPANIAVGDGTVGPYTITTPANTGIVPGTVVITDVTGAQIVTDDLFGNLQGDGTGTVDYLNGVIVVTFNVAVGLGNNITLGYTQLNTPINSCRHIFQFKDRCVLANIIDNAGINFGLRLYISGTGAFADIFVPEVAVGAGFIDIPDQTFIQSGDFNRDDLILYIKNATWIVKYTGNDAVPFSLDKLDNSRGSEAPYGTITYLNRTSAESTLGFTICDGYTVARSDEKIPDYSFNYINQKRFELCYAGSVDEDRDHYLIHPSPGQNVSDRILVTNYEEDNFSVYRLPLSCMGNFYGAFDITWNDLSIYNSWDEMASVYGTWASFSFADSGPFSVGGGHHGQITRLNVTELQDYPVKIRGISVIDDITLRITTDYQDFEEGMYIYFDGISGMVELNDKQAQITSVLSHYVFDVTIQTENFSAYTSGGTASKVIVFQTKTKKFNPFAGQNQKVRCGWVYFYVSTTGTSLTENKYIQGIDKTNPCVITINNHGYKTGYQVFVDGVTGTTQLNKNYYYITVIDENNFSLDGVDATAYGTWTGSGFTSTPVPAKLLVNVIVNDREEETELSINEAYPYQVNLTSDIASQGIKKWYKLYINQVGRFVQFEFLSNQAGSKIEIQSIVPGLAGVGRLI